MSYHFRDPIHGMVAVNNCEEKIIKSKPFQRLRHIKQLGTTFLVYHGADHTRFGHSIGVMHLVSQALESLRKKEPLKYMGDEEYEKLKQTARIAALLHDVGHAPFSHVGENEEYKLFPQLMDVDGNLRAGHEAYTHLIIRDLLGKIIEKECPHINIADVLGILMRTVTDAKHYFICDLMDGQLDVDKMDYLLRDSHYCGVKYGSYDLGRMMDVICICPTKFGEWRLGIDSDGVHAVEEFIFARYWMFLQVYFHKTRRIYDYFLSRFLQEEFNQYPKKINDFLDLSDPVIFEKIKNKSSQNPWAKCIYTRTHMKEIYVSTPHYEDDTDFDRVVRLIESFKNDFAKEISAGKCYVDQADTSSAKSLIKIRRFLDNDSSDYEEAQMPAIPVKDKHNEHIISPIQEFSLPIRAMSDRKINQFRIYAERRLIAKAEKYVKRKREAIDKEIGKENDQKNIILKKEDQLVQEKAAFEAKMKLAQERIAKYKR